MLAERFETNIVNQFANIIEKDALQSQIALDWEISTKTFFSFKPLNSVFTSLFIY